jgi:hypothetical protein
VKLWEFSKIAICRIHSFVVSWKRFAKQLISKLITSGSKYCHKDIDSPCLKVIFCFRFLFLLEYYFPNNLVFIYGSSSVSHNIPNTYVLDNLFETTLVLASRLYRIHYL